MSLCFKPRKYICLDCSGKGKILTAFASLRNITENFPTEKIIDPIEDVENNALLYEQTIERDDFGLVIKREAFRSKCEHCGSIHIEAIKMDNEDNVLNFFAESQSAKWLGGFEKVR